MHTFDWGDWRRDSRPGAGRADLSLRFRAEAGHDLHFASRCASRQSPAIRTLSATVTRRSRSGDILGPNEPVDVQTALKAMTIWPAFQHFEETTTGSFEVGKTADFVILDRNPLAWIPKNCSK